MAKEIRVRDLTLCSNTLQLLANQLTQEEALRLLSLYQNSKIYSAEAWDNTDKNTLIKIVLESPWFAYKQEDNIPNTPFFSVTFRARYLFAQTPIPDYVAERLFKKMINQGIKVIRIYDSLNDLDNLRDYLPMINALGGISDGALIFASDPIQEKTETHEKKSILARLFGSNESEPSSPTSIYTDDYYIEKAKQIESAGAKILTLEDSLGIATPSRIFSLMPKLKQAIRIPVSFQTRAINGNGLATMLTAIIKGVDIVDTCILPLDCNAYVPIIEIVNIFCNKIGIKLEANIETIAEIRSFIFDLITNYNHKGEEEVISLELLMEAQEKLYTNLPLDIDQAFYDAIGAASENREFDLIKACQQIENYFKISTPDTLCQNTILHPDIEYNLHSELQTLKADYLIEEAASYMNKIRIDAGSPPLSPQIAEILAAQASAMAIDIRDGKQPYSTICPPFIQLITGGLGQIPGDIDSSLQKYTGELQLSPAKNITYSEPENPQIDDLIGTKLATSDDEYLLLELDPALASEYLRDIRSKETLA